MTYKIMNLLQKVCWQILLAHGFSHVYTVLVQGSVRLTFHS